MSQITSSLQSVALILSIPPRLLWTLIEVSARQALGQSPTGTWSENIEEALVMFAGAHASLPFLRSMLPVDPNKIRNSNRYSGLGDQLLTHVRQSTFEGYWICRGLKNTPIEPKDADLVIFYLHGGGYVLGHPILEAPNLLFIAECLAKEGLTTAIFASRYSLSPEAHFPQQINEVASAYHWLVRDLGVTPSRVALMGESAGGHLALSFLLDHHLKTQQSGSSAAGIAKPASVFLLSPWCDLHNSNSKAMNIRPNEVVFKRTLTKWGDLALGDLDPPQRDMFMNFARRDAKRGSLRDILPSSSWISAGDDEVIFVHDIIDFVSAARDDGTNITLEIEPGGRHAWQSAAARPEHAAVLQAELGTDSDGPMTAWKRLATSIAVTVKSTSSLDERL
ncbi:alpha/beta-hydrolase [Didymella exigua CBS 183.55]|uniref:Alpha/beta-hydrolase n=1 Tax=Didymella exigua CBS 183.55 TaxID=1150837 RepID=A0A6A5S1N9_9PLEO|nr:alpha/beta-hydrolase [Didymella exigua CBS 183.55]KAF1933364.1 alpha/beta-hydrolase [Didymella exigua CBS 183.55]